MKKVIYTCITGNYDVLSDPLEISDRYDYICFTDSGITSEIWEIRPIPNELKYLSIVKQQRAIKVNPHKYLSDYDFSIWIDGNILLKKDINRFVYENCREEDGHTFAGRHPDRNTIKSECRACVIFNKETKKVTDEIWERYSSDGFPDNLGLSQTCVVFRYHNDESCVKLMDFWWKEIEAHSHRDQLSLSYAMWKTNTKINYLPKDIFHGAYFSINGHGNRNRNNFVKGFGPLALW